MNIDNLLARKNELDSKVDTNLAELDSIIKDAKDTTAKVAEVDKLIDSIDKEFEDRTALTKQDFIFVLFAAFLQSVRWIMMPELKLPQIDKLTPEVAKAERLGANESNHIGGIYSGKSSGAIYELDELKKYREKHVALDMKSREEFYKSEHVYRSWIEILTQPVPYDAMNALDKSIIPNIGNLNKVNFNGKHNNIYGANHHVATLGHDPILGWIFGTANILTSTISFVGFQNYRVKRGHSVKSLGEFIFSNELQFSDQIIDYSKPCNLFEIGYETINSIREDPKRLPAAVVRQSIHFASDKYCIEGLPIPILSTINPEKSQELIEKGWNSVEIEKLLKFDAKQIGISAISSIIINMIIEAIYLMCLKTSESLDIRRVKVNKILSMAGIISSSSNILYTAITKNISKVDIGGIGVTMLELLHSEDFIAKVKMEYLKSEFEREIMG